MEKIYLAYLILGFTLLILSLIAGVMIQFLWISEPMVAMIVGILIGPQIFHFFQPHEWGNQTLILEELARLTVAISLMGVAFRLPGNWLKVHWKPFFVILFLGMPLMSLISGLCGYLFLDLPWLEAFVLGAALAPTDPVLANTIVTGEVAEKSIPADIRNLISAESGANDGLAYLLMMLPSLLLRESHNYALWNWGTHVLIMEVILPCVVGLVFGALTAKVLVKIYAWEHVYRESLLAVTVAVVLALLGLIKVFGGNEFLPVFIAGVVLNWAIRRDKKIEEAQHEHIQENVRRFLDVPVFIFFGMILPWQEWLNIGWPLLLFAVAILCLRRPPALLLLFPLLAPLKKWSDALFVGWFGPIGAAAMVYLTWSKTQHGENDLWVYGSFAVFASIMAFGITATPLTKLYGRSGLDSTNPNPSSANNRV